MYFKNHRLHGYTKTSRMIGVQNFTEDVNGFRQKMGNLELSIEFVIRAEPFILDQTSERVTYSHLIGL